MTYAYAAPPTERALNAPPWPPRTGAQLTAELDLILWFERGQIKAGRVKPDHSGLPIAVLRLRQRRKRIEILQGKPPPWASNFSTEETFR